MKKNRRITLHELNDSKHNKTKERETGEVRRPCHQIHGGAPSTIRIVGDAWIPSVRLHPEVPYPSDPPGRDVVPVARQTPDAATGPRPIPSHPNHRAPNLDPTQPNPTNSNASNGTTGGAKSQRDGPTSSLSSSSSGSDHSKSHPSSKRQAPPLLAHAHASPLGGGGRGAVGGVADGGEQRGAEVLEPPHRLPHRLVGLHRRRTQGTAVQEWGGEKAGEGTLGEGGRPSVVVRATHSVGHFQSIGRESYEKKRGLRPAKSLYPADHYGSNHSRRSHPRPSESGCVCEYGIISASSPLPGHHH